MNFHIHPGRNKLVKVTLPFCSNWYAVWLSTTTTVYLDTEAARTSIQSLQQMSHWQIFPSLALPFSNYHSHARPILRIPFLLEEKYLFSFIRIFIYCVLTTVYTFHWRSHIENLKVKLRNRKEYVSSYSSHQ